MVRSLVSVAVLLLSLLTPLCCQAKYAVGDDQQPSSKPCRLYLAPSHLNVDDSITKFSLYAGVDYDVNETLPFHDLAIPLVDFLNIQNTDVHTLLEKYLWTAEYAGAQWSGNASTALLIPGLGSLALYHAGISNVDWVQASTLLYERNVVDARADEVSTTSFPHSTRTAITPFSNLTMRATTHIQAGMELFANFGDVWDAKKATDPYEQTISRWDYTTADQVIDKLLAFYKQYDGQLDTDLKEDVLDLVVDRILGAAAGKRAKAIRSLIPANPRRLQQVKDAGGTFSYRNKDMVKSQAWLQQHGTCVDLLEPKRSTVPEAGRGAFATRDISEGERIAISPMLPIADEEVLNMHPVVRKRTVNDGDEDEEEEPPTVLAYNYDERPVGQQLVLNYAFGHDRSSLLLVPTAPMVTLINHSPEPNAHVDWSSHDKIVNDFELHERIVEEIRELENPATFVIEIVAARDIAKGEEIFIDYGSGWQDAWDEYSSEQPNNDNAARAAELVRKFRDSPFPTAITTDNNPYGDTVATACFIQADNVGDGQPQYDENHNEILKWIGPTTYAAYDGHGLVGCDLLDRRVDVEHGFVYTVRAVLKEEEGLSQVNDVPHAAITLVDLPYSGDIHAPGAFRRWIGFPDEKFPQQWRNLR